MQPRLNLFTSESVAMGHPDKVADRIADTILDHLVSHDPHARVAVEALVTSGHVVVAGEVSSRYRMPQRRVVEIVEETAAAIGYDDPRLGWSLDGVDIHVYLQRQAADIERGVVKDDGELGAGDQGMMFGYATRQTDELMPLPIVLAHRLVARQAQVRQTRQIPDLGPDAKAQVTVAFEGETPVGIDSVVLSTHHGPSWNDRQEELHGAVRERILAPVLGGWWRDDLRTFINPTGKFEIGGPAADTGLTGRKIIVDTYGGWARHGGGAFSGKDPSKVDRSAGYMARYVAKNVVAAGLADECEVRLSYAIGVTDPTSVVVDCRGTARVDEAAIERAVREIFPLTPAGIIEALGLRRPIYQATSYHGHFGRTPGDDGTFTWERTDRAGDLRSALGVSSAAV